MRAECPEKEPHEPGGCVRKRDLRLNPNTLEPACSERWKDVLWAVLAFTGTLCVVHLETSIKVLLTNFVFLSRPFSLHFCYFSSAL